MEIDFQYETEAAAVAATETTVSAVLNGVQWL